VNIDGRHICRYERDRIRPARKVIKGFADIFQIPEEELLAEKIETEQESLIEDKELLKLLQEIEKMEDEERKLVKGFLETMVMKKHLKDLVVRKA
jgi:transcriptional regulator with XRE-family HTH domain